MISSDALAALSHFAIGTCVRSDMTCQGEHLYSVQTLEFHVICMAELTNTT